jgi:GT2 family glycosyltransferase
VTGQAEATEDNCLSTNATQTISIVMVLFRNDNELVRRLVRSLDDAARRAGFETEVVIVVNDESAFEGDGAEVVISGQGNVGFAAGVERGIRAARGEHCLIANPDCLPDVDQFAVFFGAMARTNGIMVPVLVDEFGVVDYVTYENWVFTPGRLLAEKICQRHLLRSSAETLPRLTKVPGTFIGMKTQIARMLNCPFDSDFFLYGEDRDMTRRARKARIPIILCRDVRITHIGGESGKTVSTMVERCRSDSALRIAHRKYGRLGVYAMAIDLLVLASLKSMKGRRGLLAPNLWAVRRWLSTFRVPCPLDQDILAAS